MGWDGHLHPLKIFGWPPPLLQEMGWPPSLAQEMGCWESWSWRARELEGCGPATMFSFGAAVASLEDVNGDGFADLAVGDPERDDATGAAWLLLLGENGSVRHKQLVASGTSPGERLGAALAVVSGVGTRELVLAVGSPGDRRGPGPGTRTQNSHTISRRGTMRRGRATSSR